jgi:hypothetical protein
MPVIGTLVVADAPVADAVIWTCTSWSDDVTLATNWVSWAPAGMTIWAGTCTREVFA